MYTKTDVKPVGLFLVNDQRTEFWRVDSSHKGTVTQNMFSFDGVLM